MTKILQTNRQTHNSPLVARLRMQMLRKGLNPKTLAEKASVGRSFVYDILSGRSCNPTSSKIAAIADELGVSMQYLLNGISADSSSLQKSWADITKISTLRVESTSDTNIIVSVDDPAPQHYFTESWVREKKESSPENLRSLKITCDSMNPTLCAEDIIVIDMTKRDINPPGIFIIFDGVSLKPRRLEMLSPNKVLVRADNDKYSQYETSPDEISIIGKLIWLGRNF